MKGSRAWFVGVAFIAAIFFSFIGFEQPEKAEATAGNVHWDVSSDCYTGSAAVTSDWPGLEKAKSVDPENWEWLPDERSKTVRASITWLFPDSPDDDDTDPDEHTWIGEFVEIRNMALCPEPNPQPRTDPGDEPGSEPCPDPGCRWVTPPASRVQCVIPLEGEPLSAVGAESGTPVPFYYVVGADGHHDSVIFTGSAEAVLGGVILNMSTGEVLELNITPGRAYGDREQRPTEWWANGCSYRESSFHPEGFSTAPQWGEGVTPFGPVCVTEPEE